MHRSHLSDHVNERNSRGPSASSENTSVHIVPHPESLVNHTLQKHRKSQTNQKIPENPGSRIFLDFSFFLSLKNPGNYVAQDFLGFFFCPNRKLFGLRFGLVHTEAATGIPLLRGDQESALQSWVCWKSAHECRERCVQTVRTMLSWHVFHLTVTSLLSVVILLCPKLLLAGFFCLRINPGNSRPNRDLFKTCPPVCSKCTQRCLILMAV